MARDHTAKAHDAIPRSFGEAAAAKDGPVVNEHSFEGRVAVVTGAGRGIGRAYAVLLASRGASVVVNDLGGSLDGVGEDAGVASGVATDIVGTGGAAIADASDVSTPGGGRSLVEAAVERFGRLDILVNNAGIIRWAGLPEADTENLASHLAVHVLGSFNTARAAWPHMVDQRYGRIVMTTSSGLFGLPKNLAYATAKGGVIGLARSLATAGAAHGIKVNLIAPGAVTRMAGQAAETGPSGGAASPWMSPDLVAPMVGFLAHESCPVSGEIYAAGFGRFSRIFIASTEGYVHATPEPTIEDVARHWATINDETGYYVPTDLMAWSAAFMSHLPPSGGDSVAP
jgi:NAD(P)-dependent dehydrogenase (short-subunit alcohol dehydrogenase family)